jgi:hypothetical protein
VTAVPNGNNGWHPESLETQLPAGSNGAFHASAFTGDGAGQGQLLAYDASGNALLADGTAPGLVAAGRASAKLALAAAAAGALVRIFDGIGSGDPSSTTSNDNFTAADVCAPAFAKDESTLGKLSNSGGSNRTLMGLVLGLAADGTPRSWVGTIAQAVASWVLVRNVFSLAEHSFADAAANTATAERAVIRPKVKGTVTRIEYIGAAVVQDDTDYTVITASARDGAGGNARTLGTFSTKLTGGTGAISALQPAVFTLGTASDLPLLETDIVTVTAAKTGAGKALTGALRVLGKAL